MKHSRGFTLVELVVVAAVIAALAAIAYPNYSRYTYKARRADGQQILQNIATAQERYYSTYNKYTSDLTKFGYATTPVSDGGHYTVSIALGTGDLSYTLTASPQGVQSADKCKNLTLTSAGTKGKSGDESNGKCW
jgi:type IV pilus assembly protein PilE